MRRAQVSASSKYDDLHKYDGMIGIVDDNREQTVRIYFTEGETLSMLIPRQKLYFLSHNDESLLRKETIYCPTKENNRRKKDDSNSF